MYKFKPGDIIRSIEPTWNKDYFLVGEGTPYNLYYIFSDGAFNYPVPHTREYIEQEFVLVTSIFRK